MSAQDGSVLDAGADYARLYRQIRSMVELAERSCLEGVTAADHPDPDALASVQNFMAYLAIRRADLRELQRDLHRIGISSLGRIETHALDSLASACTILARLSDSPAPELCTPRLTYDAGEQILARRTELFLGPRPPYGSTRIMVTMPTEAGTDEQLAGVLLKMGMQVARINCAHDGPAVWAAMVRNLRRAARELDRPCVIVCDLPGPKLRTGPMETGPGVVRWHAFKDPYGKVIAPARIWISAAPLRPPLAQALLPVNAEFVAPLRLGDELHFRDFQGRLRWVTVTAVAEEGVWAESARGAFMVEGIALSARREGVELPIAGRVGRLPPKPRDISLGVGDSLWLTPDSVSGRPGTTDAAGRTEAPRIGCSLPEIFQQVKPGERVFFDDGKIATVIEDVQPDRIRLSVTWVRGQSSRLTQDKGINFPDSTLKLPSLTPADVAALDFIIAHRDQIDAVGLSFVRDAGNVDALHRELDRQDAANLGVLLKIETATAFQNLPGIVISALRRNRVGVMIARGDLGVEVGFERMAELQEEIGSLCAAAHLPVVWATQVLETLAKKGMPSRAEVSDVVLAARTQCVMLNKGPHLAAAIRFLTDVLGRMEGHQDKHFRLMRALRVAMAHPKPARSEG